MVFLISIAPVLLGLVAYRISLLAAPESIPICAWAFSEEYVGTIANADTPEEFPLLLYLLTDQIAEYLVRPEEVVITYVTECLCDTAKIEVSCTFSDGHDSCCLYPCLRAHATQECCQLYPHWSLWASTSALEDRVILDEVV